MPERPQKALFTKTHEWLLVDGEIGTVGITDYAITHLSDIVFIDLPTVGTITKQNESFGEIESVKAVASLNAPVSGEVVEVNESIRERLEVLSEDTYGAGWLIKIKLSDVGELKNLMNLAEYNKFCEEQESH
ncbi:MAG: glycine cleavage system protein GcvH [Planctomycetota bacterium]|nr:glycine cleavage system protein GcvH [Planctomycetota bacterium]